MKFKIVLMLLITLVVLSCRNDKNNLKSEISKQEDILLLDTLQLRLNHGDKWIVNNETHVGISRMDSILKGFQLSPSKDYVSLGNNLSKQTSFVIKNCSMKGESHDQLHVVLVPMLDEISILKEREIDSEKALQRLEALLEDYFEHFKL